MMANAQKYKIALIGSSGVGKTTLINRLKHGSFQRRYISSYGSDVTEIILATSQGYVILDIWDCAGGQYIRTAGDASFINADLGVVMFDKSNILSFKYSLLHARDLYRVNENVKFHLVGNKCDIESKPEIETLIETTKRELHCEYCDLSVKDSINIDKLILDILKKVTGNPEITVSQVYIIKRSYTPLMI
jgi:small GTP-binding protein